MSLKSFFSSKLDFLMPVVAGLPFGPNTATFLSLLSGLVAAYYILQQQVLLGALFAAIAFALDGLDGLIARAKKASTAFGAYFDGITDRIVEFFIISPMLLLLWPNQIVYGAIIILIGFGTFLTAFAKAYADHRSVVLKKDLPRMRCVLERAERVLLILLALILYNYNVNYSSFIIVFTSLLSMLSFLQRFLFVVDYSRSK